MNDKARKVLAALLTLHTVVGLAALGALAVAAPMAIGEGRFEAFVHSIETFDVRWPLFAIVAFVWLVPIGLFLLFRQARAAGLELDQLRGLVRRLLQDKSIPVRVDVDTRVPVEFDAPLTVPVEIHTKVGVDEEIEIETELPVKVDVPVDTEVETTVLRFGKLRIPIQTTIPLDLVLPVKGRIRIRAQGIPVDLNETATVKLPPIEVPIRSRIDTKIDLLANLEQAGEALRRRTSPREDGEPALETEPKKT